MLSRKPAHAFRNIKRRMRIGFDRRLGEGPADKCILFFDLMVDEETVARMSVLNGGRRDIRDRDWSLTRSFRLVGHRAG